MTKFWGIYYYSNKVDASDKLNLKLYTDGFDTEKQACTFMEEHSEFMDATNTKLNYLVLPYYFKKDGLDKRRSKQTG